MQNKNKCIFNLKKANKIYHERRDVLCRLLSEQLGDRVFFKIPDGGFAIWVKYLHDLNAASVAEKAAEMGLSVSNGNDYFYNDDNHRFIRLGFASLNLKELEDGVEILGRAINKLL